MGARGQALALVAVLAALVSACSRPLTEGEAAFAAALLGDGIDTSRVRVVQGIGLLPPARGVFPPYEVPRDACDRVEQTERTVQLPAGTALGNAVLLRGRFYSGDTLHRWPAPPDLPPFLVMTHELVHVWQWQNRDVTGYTPLRALHEARRVDPYYYGPEDTRDFLSFGYEQQAALVTDYICYAVYDPSDPRRAEIRAVLAPVFPLGRIDAELSGAR